MTGHHHTYTGYGIMSRIRPTCSHQNLRTTWAPDQQAEQCSFAGRPQRNKSLSAATPAAVPAYDTRPRNHSVSHPVPSSTPRKLHDSSRAGHWPPLEFDPLKLNPTTVVEVEVSPRKPPPRLYERDLLRTRSVHTKKTQAVGGSEIHRRPRLHHSDSGISFDYNAYRNETEMTAAQSTTKELSAPHEEAVNDHKGWPSPASSVDSGKSWFDLDDDSEDEDDEEDEDDDDASSVTDESEGEQGDHKDMCADVPSPQRRPQVGSPDDPTHYLKRGAWKRRAIFFGQQSNEVYTQEEDAFDCL